MVFVKSETQRNVRDVTGMAKIKLTKGVDLKKYGNGKK